MKTQKLYTKNKNKMKSYLVLPLIFLTNFSTQYNREDDKNFQNYELNFAVEEQNIGSQIFKSDPMQDAIIVSGSKYCNPEWKPKNIKNNSSTQFLTITVNETTSRPGSGIPPSNQTLVFSKLAPQEQRELGCAGCGFTTTGQLCIGYKVIAAVYIAP
ncbi:MAG: hypothetical protein ABIN67_02960 [Ferruginibacter sp.]